MPLSGKETVKLLQKHGFLLVRQRGSHIVLSKVTSSGKRTAVVPQHKELQKGTLRSIAKQAGLDKSELGL